MAGGIIRSLSNISSDKKGKSCPLLRIEGVQKPKVYFKGSNQVKHYYTLGIIWV